MLAIALNAAPANAADSIGRLFSSPAERSNLDYLRQTKKTMVAAPIKTDEPASPIVRAERAPVILPDAINMQGYVKRNDGKQGTVWVNDQAMSENSANRDVQIGALPENSNRIPIKLNANGKRINIKAGQVYEPQTNQVREARNHAAQGDSGTIGD
jgi:hypothetical protein